MKLKEIKLENVYSRENEDIELNNNLLIIEDNREKYTNNYIFDSIKFLTYISSNTTNTMKSDIKSFSFKDNPLVYTLSSALNKDVNSSIEYIFEDNTSYKIVFKDNTIIKEKLFIDTIIICRDSIEDDPIMYSDSSEVFEDQMWNIIKQERDDYKNFFKKKPKFDIPYLISSINRYSLKFRDIVNNSFKVITNGIKEDEYIKTLLINNSKKTIKYINEILDLDLDLSIDKYVKTAENYYEFRSKYNNKVTFSWSSLSSGEQTVIKKLLLLKIFTKAKIDNIYFTHFNCHFHPLLACALLKLLGDSCNDKYNILTHISFNTDDYHLLYEYKKCIL